MALSAFRTLASVLMLTACSPLLAQTLEDLDALAQQTVSEAEGIAAAQLQVDRGELLEALASLERVLTKFPESAQARFNHAMLLCWIDDPQGALVEFERLDEDDYEPGVLEQAKANCRNVTREGEQ